LQDAIKKAKEEANQQIEQYANDTGLKQKYKDCNIIKLIVVYYGWEMKEIVVKQKVEKKVNKYNFLPIS
jgi:hypothetical protein